MDNYLFQNMSEKDRKQMLSDNAERREDFQYPKELSHDEIQILKDELSNESITLSKLEEKKKELMAEFKTEIDPVKQEVKRLLHLLRTRSEEVEEKVYLIADQEEGMMGYYNTEGKLVHQRILRGEEKQLRIIGGDSQKSS